MPKSLSRLLIVLVLALMVPIQGIAAVGADLCMGLGHHGHGSAGHEHGSAGHGHGHDGPAPVHHHDEGKGTDKSSAHCPPCASCCATTAIASFPDVVIPDQPGYSVLAESVAFFAGAPLHRLDRPPLAL